MKQKYLGITPYDEDGGFEFAGRDNETWTLYDRIIRNEYTVYYAASGEGKSSLIRAGLLPILRRRDYFPIYIVFEDKELDHISSIEDVINNRIEVESDKHSVVYEQSMWSKERFDVEQAEKLKDNFWWRIRNYCFKHDDKELKPFFIFDQFEEVFTKASYDWTDHFFEWLEEISTDYVPDNIRCLIDSEGGDMPTQKNYKALFSFRTEYLGDLDYWCVQKHFIPSLQDNRMCLKPLTPKGARDIINLNEKELGIYADMIIKGCSDSQTNTVNENQPCIYALILSVVCQTLSDISEKDRISLLDNLQIHQDETIDDILLRFYKRKLKAVGLDYIKNEKIIADIENALVDEKGKRSRRDTDEASMQAIAKWINLLSDKNNGLLKIIGKKVVGGIRVNTVEFPHDRLCKAIDTSRKERQGKIAWKLNRQGEWMQFGIISAVVGIVVFLWNTLLPSLKPIVNTWISGEVNILFKKLSDYLQGEDPIINDVSLSEGFSTLLLMVLLALFVPLMTTFVSRKKSVWEIASTVISMLSSLCFGWLLFHNMGCVFSSNYIQIFSLIGFVVSFGVLTLSAIRIKNTSKRVSLSHTIHTSLWPLWGGYFLFASYLFYELLRRTTFGISEPKDSCLEVILLPLLYLLWAWGFFNMTIKKENGKRSRIYIPFFFIFLLLCVISYISYIPAYSSFKQIYGFISSLLSIVLIVAIFGYVLWNVTSNSQYYNLSISKRIFVVSFGAVILISTFLLNLGFNPMVIRPSSVCHVSSWRIVTVKDAFSPKLLGIKFALNGETIVPTCIAIDSTITTKLVEGKYPFSGGVPVKGKFLVTPFNEKGDINNDGSFRWVKKDSTAEGKIPVSPTLEEYLQKTIKGKLLKNHNLKDSINFYAANLFVEIRNANINFALKGDRYNLDVLPSLDILDSLQQIALKQELSKFVIREKDSIIFPMDSMFNPPRTRVEVLEDKDLIDFHCELSRSIMMCLIRDRVNRQDFPNVFTLTNTYLLAFFTDIPAMKTYSSLLASFNGNKPERYLISSDDILERKPFAWYDLYNSLCAMDMSWNANILELFYKGAMETFRKMEKVQKEFLQELIKDQLALSNQTAENLLDSLRMMVNMINKRKNLPNKYEKMTEKFDSINFVAQHEVADLMLNSIKNMVLEDLLAVMNERSDGIYNNDFENICQKLILVSAIRGNDIDSDTAKFSKYLSDKQLFFSSVKEATNGLNRLQNEKRKSVEQIRSAINKMRE